MTAKISFCISLLVSFLIIGFGCNDYAFEKTFSFDNSNWKITDTAIFQYSPASISQSKDIYISIAHETNYQYGNIYLFTEIDLPDNTHIKDTIQCVLIDNNYHWIGSGTNTKTATFPFKQSVTFPQEGTYTFKLTQAMRVQADSILHGIESISLLIK